MSIVAAVIEGIRIGLDVKPVLEKLWDAAHNKEAVTEADITPLLAFEAAQTAKLEAELPPEEA